MDSADPRESDDLCGRELVPEFPQEDLAEEYDPETWYEDEEGTHYCCREVLDRADDDRCIWHADIADKPADALAAARSEEPARLDRANLRQSDLRDGVSFSDCRLPSARLGGANLSDADLGDANFFNADLGAANLVGVDLGGAGLWRADLGGAVLRDADLDGTDLRRADLGDATLEGADLGDATLVGADLGGAFLVDADLDGADLSDSRLSDSTFQKADLTDADLERADCTRANLFDADLHGARLYGAVLANVQLNTDTEFGDHYTDASDDPDPDKATWTLRHLERLFRENALPERARDAYLDRKDRRRQQYWNEGDHGRALLATGYGATMRYGESPWRVVGISVATVLLGAALYPLWGMKVGKAGEAVTTISYPFETVGVVTGLGKSLYLSVITFTTLGYGDVQPLGFGEALATVESFVGALLMALLVFVLGRRATW